MVREISQDEEALEAAHQQGRVSLARDASWLRLAIAKKQIGLKRLTVMLEYDSHKSRTKADAQRAADAIGVKLRSFYALLKAWRESGRSPIALVPYGEDSSARKSRLPENVADKLRKISAKVVSRFPAGSTGALLILVRQAWKNDADRPSDVTIRSYIERAREEHRPDPGAISAEALGFNGPEKSTGFGDVLIIDHTAPADILIKSSSGTIAPTVTLVIDEFTGATLGASTYDGYPNGDAVIASLVDAKRRLARIAPGCDLKGATIVFATTNEREWHGLVDELLSEGFSTSEHTDVRLVVGNTIRHVVGTSLDDVVLHSNRAIRKEPELRVDPERKALLSLKDARVVIEDAVEKEFHRRVEGISLERTAPSPGIRNTRHSLVTSRSANFDDAHSDQVVAEHLQEQRMKDAYLQIRLTSTDRNRLAGLHTSPGKRSPGIFRRQLKKLAQRVGGDHILTVDVTDPTSSAPAWELRVTVDDVSLRTPIWIELAREALDLADNEMTFVHVTVNVQNL